MEPNRYLYLMEHSKGVVTVLYHVFVMEAAVNTFRGHIHGLHMRVTRPAPLLRWSGFHSRPIGSPRHTETLQRQKDTTQKKPKLLSLISWGAGRRGRWHRSSGWQPAGGGEWSMVVGCSGSGWRTNTPAHASLIYATKWKLDVGALGTRPGEG